LFLLECVEVLRVQLVAQGGFGLAIGGGLELSRCGSPTATAAV
jgi:hypothetical protein